MNNSDINIIDCTIRDGGYYNDWCFVDKDVDAYLLALSSAKVSYAEIGFRFGSASKFLGPYAFLSDSYISRLTVPPDLKLAVMINGKDILRDGRFDPALLNRFVASRSSESRISMIRLACHLDELPMCSNAVLQLKSLGYEVGLNLMQISEYSDLEIITAISELASLEFDVFYIADSLGALDSDRLKEVLAILFNQLSVPIGVHLHDNMYLALELAKTAIKYGVRWIDSTVTGMGRGPGNLKTEVFLSYLNHQQVLRSNLLPLYSIVDSYFLPMQKEYGWGSNLYYYLSGLHRIHPTYIQNVLSDPSYTTSDLLSIIEFLKDRDSARYNQDVLVSRGEDFGGSSKPNSDLSFMTGRKIMIIASGPSAETHRDAVVEYIKKFDPIVLALNTVDEFYSTIVDYNVVCNFYKFLSEIPRHLDSTRSLICPAYMYQYLDRSDIRHINYGVEVGADYKVFENHCCLPHLLVFFYALSICKAAGCESVGLVGFDGYPAGDERNALNRDQLSVFQKSVDLDLFSLTSNQYGIAEVGIYEKLL